MIRINRSLSIPDWELRFSFERGGGPGGQHANKVSTRVTLWFDVAGSPSLTPDQRRRILAVAGRRASLDGMLRIVSGEERSQAANRQAAVARLIELARDALRPQKKRRATKPTAASEVRRRVAKESRSRIKRGRRERPSME